MFAKRGELFVISAPSGAGKTTLSAMLLRKFEMLSYSVSYTTRASRANEVDGVHYHFVNTDTFERMAEEGDFIEYACVHGNMYGTSRKYIESVLAAGGSVLMDIDPQGALQLMDLVDYGVYVFILPPSLEVLRERLYARRDTYDSIDLRMSNAAKEMALMPKYDYAVINDNLERAFEEVSAIYIAERCRTRLIIDHLKFI